MTELERKALLGDPEAQKQCTEQGIILPCPRCAKYGASTKYVMGDYWYECPHCHSASGFHSSEEVALSDWNTRAALPIGKCKDCQYTCPGSDDSYIVCVVHGHAVKDDGWCSEFEPKEPSHGTL